MIFCQPKAFVTKSLVFKNSNPIKFEFRVFISIPDVEVCFSSKYYTGIIERVVKTLIHYQGRSWACGYKYSSRYQSTVINRVVIS